MANNDVRLFATRSEIIAEFQASQTAGKDYVTYGLSLMGVEDVWKTTTGAGTVIAVLDTGIDVNHPDLKGAIIGGQNFTTDYNGDPTNYTDNQYHGTHVAGIIAGRRNSSGVIGVAPDVKLLICKVVAGSGTGSADWLANAVRYCINWRGPNGEKVGIINMSLGTKTYHVGLHNAIKDAVASDIAIICAAGNDGDGSATTEEISYPAYLPEVITVGAVNFDRQTANFSNSNREVDVAGPGVDVISCYPGGKYAVLNGTSQACPHVTGFAALVREKYRLRNGFYPTETELYGLLKYHTVDVDAVGIDASTGAGFVTASPSL